MVKVFDNEVAVNLTDFLIDQEAFTFCDICLSLGNFNDLRAETKVCCQFTNRNLQSDYNPHFQCSMCFFLHNFGFDYIDTLWLLDYFQQYNDLDPNDISYKMIVEKLKSLNQNKACGPYKIHSFLLKNCAEAFANSLTLLIISSSVNSQLPVQFRSANITPLFKKGDKAVPSNYCPVSLISIPCKIIESIIRAKMKVYLCKNNQLAKEQQASLKINHVPLIYWKPLTSFHRT